MAVDDRKTEEAYGHTPPILPALMEDKDDLSLTTMTPQRLVLTQINKGNHACF